MFLASIQYDIAQQVEMHNGGVNGFELSSQSNH